MSDDLAAILAEHGDADDVTFDLTTPRQYTQHGGWNERCQCGAVIGDHQSPGNVVSRHRAHVAQVIADTYLPAVVREAEQRGREDNADHGMCYVHGSEALAVVVREAEARAWDEGYEAGYRLQQGRSVDRPRRGGL